MPAPIRELLHFVSPFAFSVEGEGEGVPIEKVLIKGFASVATDDRSGDRTDPREFNVAEFMAAPTLLINHKFWIDAMGNAVAIGRPLSMHAAKISDIGSDKEWGVTDLKTRKQINTFPKDKVPSLRKGTRGLFITAEVTQPDVQRQIANGELGGMSWRGLVEVVYELGADGQSVRVLKDIDLFEISVTHIPDHNQSTFVVGKSVNGKFEEVEGMTIQDMQLRQVRMEKTKFASRGMAVEYLKHHGLKTETLREDEYSFFADQQSPEYFDIEKTVRVKMGEAYMLLAPPKAMPKPVLNPARLVAELVDVAKSSNLKEPAMADEKKEDAKDVAKVTDTGDENVKTDVEKAAAKKAADDAAAEKEKKAKAADGKEDKQKSAAEEQLEMLGTHTAKAVATSLEPTLTGIAGALTKVGEGLSTLTEVVGKMAKGVMPEGDEKKTDTDTDTEKKTVAKSADTGDILQGMVDRLGAVTSQVEEQQKVIVDIAKSAVAMGKLIPNKGIERAETVKTEVQKKAEDADPNTCFDSSFPFLA